MSTEPTVAEQNGLLYQIRQTYGPFCDSDSYKLSHIPQYPENSDMMISYFESRGGNRDKILWYGIRLLVKEYLLQRLTRDQAINMAQWAKEHIVGFNLIEFEEALKIVADEYNGRIPIKIRAAKEGYLIPIKNVLFTIESAVPDKRIFSIVSYFEAKLSRVYGPTTVATTSYYVRQDILEALEESSDDPMIEIDFKFHDFGGRAPTGMESAAFNGSGHLVSFKGTDTQIAVQVVEFAYNERMAGFSIPASEHSTTTTHGRYGESKLVSNMFKSYAQPGAIFATVIDSYDALAFVREIGPMFKEKLQESGSLFWVFRPDSGDPVKMPIKIVQELDKVFGCTINTKGFKVLNGVRVIQGDGIEPWQIKVILRELMDAGYSASNIAFGMGGGLLQKFNRDTHKFAMKACAIRTNGEWVDVYKDPAEYDENWNKIEGKSFKASKAGRLELIRNPETGDFKTIRLEEMVGYLENGWEEALELVYNFGYIHNETNFSEIRKRAGTIV